MEAWKRVAIDDPEELIFGTAPRPLETAHGLVIGGGRVHPELNFTLPAMHINDDTWPAIVRQYGEIIADALERAQRLHCEGLVVEFETLPDMTRRPRWTAEIVEVLMSALEDARSQWGLNFALRATPNDNREMIRPPKMRSGQMLEDTLESFRFSAELGADLLSIESTGGKEIHDGALTMADLPQVIFSLCVLGARDMRFLWTQIAEIADAHDGVFAAGDTACGFANTAMVLAEQSMIPRVFAAVVRAVSAVRSLVAYECGAVGPGKDCGYENIILKALTGLPMSMEGKTAACAHSSPVGNISAAGCDLWSNESVQNIKLLGGWAPGCYLEQLIYDCRLMNAAIEEGPEAALALQRWLVDSDASLDPQAFVLMPRSAIAIAEVIAGSEGHYDAGRKVAAFTIGLLLDAVRDEVVDVPEREVRWLEMMEASVEALPAEEDTFIEQMLGQIDRSKLILEDYDLPV
ncbi:MAG: methanol--corrinoid methyltransferase [candidate division WS1 bacterium]|jgi:methanol--5-hydroxybenzimidazolylcobamide Co-methyltransferase|nr:methanol--corrinoid methyltransferase [candidate division WS1 bacterium]